MPYSKPNISLLRKLQSSPVSRFYKHFVPPGLVLFVDALIAATAERLNVKRLLTLDRRDFQLIRPRHCDGFELLP